MTNVLTICGSLRKGSYNRALANSLPALAPAAMTLTDAPSIRDIPHYDGDVLSTDSFPQQVTKFADAIRTADGIIIVSPEYNWSIPGVLKNAIDWVSRMPDQPFKDKPVALQSASPGILGGSRMQYHLRQVMASIDALVFVKPEIIVTFAATKTNEAGQITDEPTREIVRQQLQAFDIFIGRVGS
jgi:chromate reductase